MQISTESDIAIYLLSHFFQIHHEYSKLKSQRNSTCGPYNLSYILRGLGFKEYGGTSISEDYLASLAQVHISIKDARKNQKINEHIKEGQITEEEAERKYHKAWHKYNLKETSNAVELGASCQGLIHACNTVTESAISALPIIACTKEGKEYLTSEKFFKLTELFIKKRAQWELQFILNYRTNKLLNMNHMAYNLFSLFEVENAEALFGYDPWSEGHYVSCGAIIKNKDEFWYLIRDTYSNKGFKGYHMQPINLVRKALIREDGREGGILLLINQQAEKEARRELKKIGLILSPWDNGSPFYRE
jgi:hypothetical protein